MHSPSNKDVSSESSVSQQKSPLSFRSTRRIQRLADIQHFHYPTVELGPIRVQLLSVLRCPETLELRCNFEIESNGVRWKVTRSLADTMLFDCQLHRCVFERRHSKLEEVDFDEKVMSDKEIEAALVTYTQRLSQLTGSLMTCYPVLKFIEIDSRGNRFEPPEETAINKTAIAAAIVTTEFNPTDPSHLRLTVGDILSIIEMSSASQDEQIFWKAKLTISSRRRNSETDLRPGFEVGYFPSSCVRLIDDKRLPSPLADHRTYPMNTARRMSDMLHRRLRRKEPIFGMDLIEHLQKTQRHIPLILERCCEAIEKLGIVTGIYRQCGIQSNIQRLRAKFDGGYEPDLLEFGQRDIYSVSSLLKQYFRQLPNPLFTFAAYSKLLTAFDSPQEKQVEKVKEILEKIPSEHYKTARYLLRHLSRICEQADLTDMTAKNLAIVWAPNLFRSPPTLNGTDSHLLSGLNVHTALSNFLITHVQELFGEDISDEETTCPSTATRSLSTASAPSRISKSATVSDMREASDRWPRFLRGRSVEGFWRFGRRSTVNGNSPKEAPEPVTKPPETVKWRRSQSTDANLRNPRAGSLINFVSRGVGEIRNSVRALRERARSVRPTSHSSPGSQFRQHSQEPLPTHHSIHEISLNRNGKSMIDSIASTASHQSEDYSNNRSMRSPQQLNPRLEGLPTHWLLEENAVKIQEPEQKERRVMFKQQATDEEEPSLYEDRPLCERSSPVEEWSSDSRDSLHLEMSRYDNVSPSGTLTRVHRDRVNQNLTIEKNNKSLFLL